MSEQEPTYYWYSGVYDDAGLDYFEPATPENNLFAIRRANGINEHSRNAKAFTVGLTLDTEHTILELMQIGEIQWAKAVILAQRKIEYVK
ncbi:MAG: hypothetical protein K5790_10450 [Nitrosopumilus sp.]|uniref:hypothetical protein n=1 Tax=Nitrosopumilus sp. TaxID=2024843 RepID=UPI00247C35AF|nr:hypothetical protein [Nitrosopumilus sp.]MCV0393690.1 hypothetical protein [Nitrosopumilus sp.]